MTALLAAPLAAIFLICVLCIAIALLVNLAVVSATAELTTREQDDQLDELARECPPRFAPTPERTPQATWGVRTPVDRIARATRGVPRYR